MEGQKQSGEIKLGFCGAILGVALPLLYFWASTENQTRKEKDRRARIFHEAKDLLVSYRRF